MQKNHFFIIKIVKKNAESAQLWPRGSLGGLNDLIRTGRQGDEGIMRELYGLRAEAFFAEGLYRKCLDDLASAEGCRGGPALGYRHHHRKAQALAKLRRYGGAVEELGKARALLGTEGDMCEATRSKFEAILGDTIKKFARKKSRDEEVGWLHVIRKKKYQENV